MAKSTKPRSASAAPSTTKRAKAPILPTKRTRPSANDVRIVFLGGLGEIGRNCAAIEVEGRILLIDCGVMFPEPDMLGVDVIIPDFTWLLERKDKIDGILLTHGHEDHTGSIRYLAMHLDNLDVYGSALSLALARPRIEEARLLRHVTFHEVADNERRRVGPIDVEFIPTTHSVPSAYALALHTPQGVILHSGDFKIDLTPVDGRKTDLTRIGALAASEGIRLLLSDSTNAENPGFTESESSVGPVLRGVFSSHPNQRIIVSCFASHLHRMQQVIDAAVGSGRKVTTLGRSMQRNVELGIDLGLLDVPAGALVTLEAAEQLPPAKVCVLSTGSQGESLSAMTLLARGANRFLTLEPNDVIVLSAHPIPGNEHSVGQVIDDLHRRGVEVVHSGHAHVHVSGHARQGELALLMQISQPEFFIPVHGEFRHMVHHAELAERIGMLSSNVLLCEDGDVVTLSNTGLALSSTVPASYVYVDGNTVDVGGEVVKARRTLADEGFVVAACAVNLKTGKVIGYPTVTAHGWLKDDRTASLLEAGAEAVDKAVALALKEPDRSIASVDRAVKRALGKYVGEKTRRKPMVVPVVVEVH